MNDILWIHDNGQICCAKHIGYYATTALAAGATNVIRTPLGTWLRVSESARREMTADFAADGLTFECEGCWLASAR
jgi:hypothetical protein